MSSQLIELTIDGKDVAVPKGTLIIRAAEQLGIEIPRFCDHPMLSPVGACRQCYVEVEGQRKLLTSCTTPVTPGMVVKTQSASDQARKAQVANLEFLLLNHPLDCPVCDRGGECPLQDQALAFGPGESRYIEAKRTYEKPIPLSPLVALDRERCVLCTRCTRFCDEISGDRFIELFERGAREQVSIAPGEDFRSPFSGNTVQICPVGALTSKTYRFVARPFDLKYADSVCPHCSAGCNIRVDTRRDEVVRHLARDNEEVNDAWLCDKGRYAFRFPDRSDRLTTPLIRARGLEPASFGEVFQQLALWVKDGRIAFLTGGRLADEDYYALSKLARTVFKTNDLDHRRDEGADLAERIIAASSLKVTYRDVENAKVIVVVGLDAEQEAPILHLRIRKAARRGAKVFVVHPRRTRLWDLAEHIICRPGEEAWLLHFEGGRAKPEFRDAAAVLEEAGPDGVVIAGPRLAAHGRVSSAEELASTFGSRFTYVSRRANDAGALRAGVHPGMLPGGRSPSIEQERAEVEALWGPIENTEPGRSTRRILEAAANREIEVLYLVGVDVLRDFPDAALARRALENVRYKVVQDIALGDFEPFADAVLPAAAFVEREGHVTDWEGRSQRLIAVRGPAGISRPDWEIFAALAEAMGKPLGFATIEELQDEMSRLLAPHQPHQWGVAAPGAGRPMVEEGKVLLFTYPLLVDEGRLSVGADELKAALEDEPFVEVHPEEAERLGLLDGADARIVTEAGEATLPVRVSEHIASGSIFVPYNQPGFVANTLLSGHFTTTATLETAGTSATETGSVDTEATRAETAAAAAGGEAS